MIRGLKQDTSRVTPEEGLRFQPGYSYTRREKTKRAVIIDTQQAVSLPATAIKGCFSSEVSVLLKTSGVPGTGVGGLGRPLPLPTTCSTCPPCLLREEGKGSPCFRTPVRERGSGKDGNVNSLLHIFLQQIADKILGIIRDLIERFVIEVPGG